MKAKFTKQESQSLTGRLNFTARVVYGGGTFLQRIIDAISTLKCTYHRKRLTVTLQKDISWWINFKEQINGTAYFVASEPKTTMEFSTDVSLVGGGGHYQNDCFYVNWKSDFLEQMERHINYLLELFTVLLELRRWGPQLVKRWIVNYTDSVKYFDYQQSITSD